MNTLRRNLRFFLYLAVGLALWYAGSATIGEHYATAVGPDFLLKIPIAIVKLAVIFWLSRWFIMDRFPSVFAYTKTPKTGISEFSAAWERHGVAYRHEQRDPRVGYSIAVFIGVHLIVSIIVIFAI